jgi:hypothetical protein
MRGGGNGAGFMLHLAHPSGCRAPSLLAVALVWCGRLLPACLGQGQRRAQDQGGLEPHHNDVTKRPCAQNSNTHSRPCSAKLDDFKTDAMAQNDQNAPAPQASADLPPAMAGVKSQAVDDLIKEMNRMPLFMTSLDETDGDGGENVALEALKALAYEGTRAEIAENFRQQGNDCARAKQWSDAKEFYTKAIAALKGPQTSRDPDAAGPGVVDVEVDEQEEADKEKSIAEAVYVNRALCNLEKSK